MAEPTQYGVVRGCKAETEFVNNVYTMIKIIGAVFHNQSMEGNNEFVTRINKYVAQKA